MVWAISFVAGLTFYILWYGIGLYRASSMSLTADLVESPVKSTQPYITRRILPLAARLGRRFHSLGKMILPTQIDQHLAWAGYPYNMRRPEFLGFQILIGIALSIAAFVLAVFFGQTLPMVLTAFVGAAVFGVYAAVLWLNSLIGKRQKSITLTMPDTFDIISTCVAAGLDFDRAVQQTVAGLDGPLAEELQTFLRELRLGLPRAEAYERLIWRNRAPELQAVVGALLQGQDLGVPVAETLEAQAENMRTARLQQAKDAGNRAATNITLISSIIVVPSVLCMFLALLGFNIWSDLAPIFDFSITP